MVFYVKAATNSSFSLEQSHKERLSLLTMIRLWYTAEVLYAYFDFVTQNQGYSRVKIFKS